MPNVINGTSTGSGGLITTGDDSGILNIQTNETTALTISTGQVVTFAQAPVFPAASIPQAALAANVAGNGPLLISGSSTGVSAPTGTTTVFTSYAASAVDTASAFNTANGRFTPQIAGYYLVSAWVGYDSNGINASSFSSNILKNNAAYAYFGSGSSSTVYPKIEVTSLVPMNGTTDYITVAAYQISGGTATNLYAQLQAVLIRAA